MSKEITLPSGRKVNWKQCPRYVLWRHGRTAHTFQLKAQQAVKSGVTDPVEQGLSLFESLSDDEAIKLQRFADDVIKNSSDVEDPSTLLEEDYWSIFGRTLYASPDAPIKTEDGETDAQSVETFPSQPVIQDSSEDVSDIPGNVASTEDGNNKSISA